MPRGPHAHQCLDNLLPGHLSWDVGTRHCEPIFDTCHTNPFRDMRVHTAVLFHAVEVEDFDGVDGCPSLFGHSNDPPPLAASCAPRRIQARAIGDHANTRHLAFPAPLRRKNWIFPFKAPEAKTINRSHYFLCFLFY
jgi:hypothetical protein